jgi:DNA topoisomerase-3
MQLVISEKPSVARDLARVLGVRGAGKHAIADGRRVITWCIGHLVELEEPAAYDARWKAWRLDTLPMIPRAFQLRAVAGTRDQLRAVRELLRDRRFTEVVNACDAGREGELIFRYVYELAGSRLPIRRLWISSMTDEAIARGFAGLRPGAEYDALGDAARCRSEADWLVGMNATRAVTITRRFEQQPGTRTPQGDRTLAPASPGRNRNGQGGGSGGYTAGSGRARDRGGRGGPPVYSIGRVQTPTLALVVGRERAITSFRPQDYWEVRGTFSTLAAGDPAGGGATSFQAAWSTPAPTGKGMSCRLGTVALADEIVARAARHGSSADPEGPLVERVRARKSREPAPQLFDLTSLQRTANRRYGLSATQTLEAAQALYERHKVLTYPRTDARHLSGDLADEMPKLFRGLAQVPEYAPFAQVLLAAGPPPRSKRVFDDGKVTDHHAIIPTGKAVRLETLSTDERRVFDLVVRRFLGVFFPDAEFALTDAVIRVGPPRRDGTAGAAAALAGDAISDAGSDDTLLTEVPAPPDRFTARGRVRLVAGWQEVAQIGEAPRDGAARGGGTARAAAGGGTAAGRSAELDDEPTATLPPLTEGQRLDGAFERLSKQTRPPPRHTEATLLGAMEYAGRAIEDETLRAAMKDTGLGTPATRAATIETLVRRDFIARQGKQIIATATGIALVEGLPVASLASPELTGAWEARLARIARGKDTREAFMSDIARYVADIVDAIRRGPGPPRAPAPPAGPGPAAPTRSVRADAARITAAAAATTAVATPGEGATRDVTLTCPRCKQGPLVAGKRGWGCSRWRQGCSFVVWFETAGRRLSAAQLRDLVAKGKTRKATWNPAGGAARTPGRLILDLEAPAPSGGARFEPT